MLNLSLPSNFFDCSATMCMALHVVTDISKKSHFFCRCLMFTSVLKTNFEPYFLKHLMFDLLGLSPLLFNDHL